MSPMSTPSDPNRRNSSLRKGRLRCPPAIAGSNLDAQFLKNGAAIHWMHRLQPTTEPAVQDMTRCGIHCQRDVPLLVFTPLTFRILSVVSHRADDFLTIDIETHFLGRRPGRSRSRSSSSHQTPCQCSMFQPQHTQWQANPMCIKSGLPQADYQRIRRQKYRDHSREAHLSR